MLNNHDRGFAVDTMSLWNNSRGFGRCRLFTIASRRESLFPDAADEPLIPLPPPLPFVPFGGSPVFTLASQSERTLSPSRRHSTALSADLVTPSAYFIACATPAFTG